MRLNPCLPLLAATSLLLASTLVDATAQRTFVSCTGVDNVNCSLVSPCRGFAAAIAATNAGGEVIVLDSAGYGAVTITKSVSLIAPAGIYAGISVFTGDGITVNAAGATVVLRGLTIIGQGGSSGVNLQQAARLRIENCVISNLASAGIVYQASGGEMIVLDSIVRDNAGAGILAAVDASSVLDGVRVEHKNGGDGIFIQSVSLEARAMITDSIFAFNGSNGIWVASTGTGKTYAQVERSVLADNGAAGVYVSGFTDSTASVMVTRNAIHRNAVSGVVVLGDQAFSGTTATVSDNAILGTFDGIRADGFTAVVHASANVLQTRFGTDFTQINNAVFYRYGNNIGVGSATGTITLHSGY